MLSDLHAYTENIIDRYDIPAASLAVWKDGQQFLGAAGTLNLDTGVKATTDSIFQIGSATKVFTASLVMQLVAEGRVDLDKPVKTYLRDFMLADIKAEQTITVRQLLNHTSGIAGDFFPDDQKEDGPHIARFVDRCAQLPLVHPVGDGFSYSNSAFAIAGRLVEVVRGCSWFDAIEEQIYQPLGMRQAICRPAQMIRFRTALGHIENTAAERAAGSPRWKTCDGGFFTLGQAPAGTMVTMTAEDLLTFGRAHLDGGLTRDGQRWMDKAMVEQMQLAGVTVPMPSQLLNRHLGLGWFAHEAKSREYCFIDHGGATNGQLAMLRLFPEQKSAFALLLNSRTDDQAAIVNDITRELTGFDCTEPDIVKPVTDEVLQACTGQFHASSGDFHIRCEGGRLISQFIDSEGDIEPVTTELVPLGELDFLAKNTQGQTTGRLRFLAPDSNGAPTRLFTAVRLYQRV